VGRRLRPFDRRPDPARHPRLTRLAAVARLRRIVSGRDEAQFVGLMTRGKSYLEGRTAMRAQTR
jgi:hypothetical protein